MNKKFKYYVIIWAILLVVFNVICFVTPDELAGMSKFDGTFWAGYIFITIAFIGQLICAYIALKADNLNRLFYNMPLLTISYTGLILTVIVGSLCMAIPNLPSWVAIIVCLLVLAFTAIAVIKAEGAAEIVENIDNKVKTKTLFIKSLTVDAENLISKASGAETKASCKKVFEAVRYSDPMSNDALADIESQISVKFSELSKAVTSGADNVSALADELVVLIGDRNRKCKGVK